MNYYVLRPDLTPYEGQKVDKTSHFEFKGEDVEQKLENLKLTTIKKTKGDRWETESKMVLDLNEGDILLFENENRGWFLPAEPIGTIETALKDLGGLATALDGKTYLISEKEE